MTKVKARLPRPLEHPARKPIVIIVTLAVGLLALLPAADDYLAALDDRNTMKEVLERAQNDKLKIDELTELRNQRTDEAEQQMKRGVSAKEVFALRDSLIDMLRDNGCRLNQIDLSETRSRGWLKNDHPVKPPVLAKKELDKNETRYQLDSHTVMISATGSLDRLRQFLAKVNQINRMIHTEAVSIRVNPGAGKQFVLDLELVFYHLGNKPKKAKT